MGSGASVNASWPWFMFLGKTDIFKNVEEKDRDSFNALLCPDDVDSYATGQAAYRWSDRLSSYGGSNYIMPDFNRGPTFGITSQIPGDGEIKMRNALAEGGPASISSSRPRTSSWSASPSTRPSSTTSTSMMPAGSRRRAC